MDDRRIGQSVPRTEDARFLTGRGRYVADLRLPETAHAVVVRSPHAHARIEAVDITAALEVPGVLAVLTAADVAGDGLGDIPPLTPPAPWGGTDAYFAARPLLASDRVRHVGDPVAFVVAETLAAAREAAELVAVEYEPIEAVTNPAAASAADAPQLWEKAAGNVGFRRAHGDAAATDKAFAAAAHVVRLATTDNRLTANSLEPRCATGLWQPFENRFTLYTSSQAPHRIRMQLAQDVFRVPEASIRVVAPDVGGGFGMKGAFYPEEALVLWAARRLGRPVSWVSERSEALASDAHGRDAVWDAELALDGDGRVLAVRAKAAFALGAYVATTGSVPPEVAATLVSGPYAIPAAHVAVEAVYTNTPPVGPYRGSGQPEAAHLIERLMDVAARRLGIDRAEIRRRNLAPPAAMPYRTPLVYTYDSGDFPAVLDRAIALAEWDGAAGRRAAAEARGRLHGIGLGCFVEVAGLFGDRVDLRFTPTGDVVVIAGTHSHGQGHETVYAQMVSEWLGVPFDHVRLLQGDTDQVPFGRGTYASRSMVVGGGALRAAADAVVERGRRIAAHLLEAAVADVAFADGRFTVSGTDRSVDIVTVARRSYDRAGLPAELGVGLEGQGTFVPSSLNFPNGCHVCELEIDPDTGVVEILRYVAVDDVGRVINPMLLEAQLQGGVAQGVGQALFEQVVYEPGSGQLLTGSFLDYCMPRATDVPAVEVVEHEVPTQTNPLGVKGAGEAGCVGAPAAIVNALVDALSGYGVEHIAMPATPERVWRAINDRKGVSNTIGT